jgi:hypothetical protein
MVAPAVDGIFSLPAAAVLKVAQKDQPRMVAHFHGGDLIVAIGALRNPFTLVVFRKDGDTRVRTYPHRPFTDEVYRETSKRKGPDDFDGFQDWLSRDLAAPPRQLVSVGDALVLVRYQGGHALIDLRAPAIEPIPRSAVEQLYLLAPDTLLVGACGYHGNTEPVQLYWAYEAARIREPLVRCWNRSTSNPHCRIVAGVPFPDEGGDIPLVAGLARLTGTNNTTHDRMHVAAAMVWQGKLFGLALSILRSGSHDHSIVRIDLASRKVDGLCALDKGDKTLRATFAPSPAGLLAFADSAVLLVDPETLAVVDRAPLPKGMDLVGTDADRLIFHHKRAKAVVVARTASIAAPLPASLAALEAEVASALQASRAAAKRRQA